MKKWFIINGDHGLDDTMIIVNFDLFILNSNLFI